MDAGDLHKLARVVRALATETTSDPGQGPSGAELLVGTDLFMNSPTSVSGIVQRTGVTQSQVSSIVAEMKREGMLVAEVDPADRRRTLLRVTPEARASHGTQRGERDPREAIARHLAQAGRPAGDADVAAVMRLLDELGTALGI